MIEFLSKWIEGIAIAVIIASIFEMILPNGNIKKYVKVILGIYIVFSIISPFVDNKVMGNFDISKKIDIYSQNFENKDYFKENGDLSNNDYSKDEEAMASNDYLKNGISLEEKLNKVYEDTFERELIQTIEKEGFSVYKCEVKGNFNAEEDNAGISKISITLESKKIIKKSDEESETTKNNLGSGEKTGKENIFSKEDENNEIKIKSVDEVKKVEINVGKKKQESTEEDVDAKDIDTLKKYLSKHYEIDKSVIEIHVR